MKKIVSLLICIMVLFSIAGCSSNVVANTNKSDNKDLLITEKTTQYFMNEDVPDEDINKILNAGINATSGMNKQDWYFSVIKNGNFMKELKEKMWHSLNKIE